MHQKDRVLAFLILFLYFVSCSGKSSENQAQGISPSENIEAIEEIPFPEIPVSITEPQEKASFIINHFWDNVNFKDRKVSDNTAFLEQNFVNFISVYPYASPEGRLSATRRLFQKVATDSIALSKIIEISDDYLFNTDSPMRNDTFYTLFLQEELTSLHLEDYDREWREELLILAGRNNPGEQATDFPFELANGEKTSLNKLSFKGDLLIFFYNPDCDSCLKAWKKLMESKEITKEINEQRLTLLAVATTDNSNLWRNTIKQMPQNWIHAFDNDNTDEHMLYDLRELPTLYLLSPDRKVLKKHMPLPEE